MMTDKYIRITTYSYSDSLEEAETMGMLTLSLIVAKFIEDYKIDETLAKQALCWEVSVCYELGKKNYQVSILAARSLLDQLEAIGLTKKEKSKVSLPFVSLLSA